MCRQEGKARESEWFITSPDVRRSSGRDMVVLSGPTRSLQQPGGERVERSQLPPGGGALWGRQGGPQRRALHGAEAR